MRQGGPAYIIEGRSGVLHFYQLAKAMVARKGEFVHHAPDLHPGAYEFSEEDFNRILADEARLWLQSAGLIP